ncbi:gamma-soluble NSF attachment protein [Panicum miliaceum]|uniref:Gamma-soluble NSF attachment protein n=1 Tax=Panicum miliaceum TaxID=4540 RepID=A0A3L6PUI8_PANMI|nr:gamma-soluble NSF attachment protein [Panicum miliaceum]
MRNSCAVPVRAGSQSCGRSVGASAAAWVGERTHAQGGATRWRSISLARGVRRLGPWSMVPCLEMRWDRRGREAFLMGLGYGCGVFGGPGQRESQRGARSLVLIQRAAAVPSSTARTSKAWESGLRSGGAEAAVPAMASSSDPDKLMTKADKLASELYRECGRAQPASDALAKGASALEEKSPEEAIKMYDEACTILEEDGKEQMAFDLYRAAAALYIKMEKYSDAAAFFLRLGSAADKCNAMNSQCKAYLSAIIIYLYAHDFQQAQKCYNDCSEVQAFLNSDQNRCATKLLSAYEEGDAEEIKRIGQSSAFNHLDHVVIRLARKLPTGDLQAIKKAADDGEDSLDEDDLT